MGEQKLPLRRQLSALIGESEVAYQERMDQDQAARAEHVAQKVCGTCKHFIEDGKTSPYGECEKISQGEGKEQPAYTFGIYGEEAWLVVLPTFGCILWEEEDVQK